MKHKLLVLGFSLFIVGLVIDLAKNSEAITVNPASAVTADTAPTALTIVYRDSSGTVDSQTLKHNGVDVSSNTASAAITGNFTQTAFNACSSTVTLNFPYGSSKALVVFSGAASNSTLDKKTSFGLEVDGQYVGNETASLGLTTQRQAVAGKPTSVGFQTVVTGLSAGAHNFCLAAWVDANTGTFDSTDSAATLTAVMLP